MATHVVRTWEETGENGRRGLAGGHYASVMHDGVWHMSKAHTSELDAVHAVLGQLKAQGISGMAKVHRASSDTYAGKLNRCKPRWQDRRKRNAILESVNSK